MANVIHTTAELGHAIRTERKALDMTQGDLAAACGVSLRFVSELERGRASAGIARRERPSHPRPALIRLADPKSGRVPQDPEDVEATVLAGAAGASPLT